MDIKEIALTSTNSKISANGGAQLMPDTSSVLPCLLQLSWLSSNAQLATGVSFFTAW